VAQLEWASSAANDLIADAVASVILRLETEAIVATSCAAPAAPLPAPEADGGMARVKSEPAAAASSGVAVSPAALKRPRSDADDT
jgi:hypothetical protein